MMLFRVIPGKMTSLIGGVKTMFSCDETIRYIKFLIACPFNYSDDEYGLSTLTMKTLLEEASSMYFPVAASKNSTSEKPAAFASIVGL